MKQTCESLKLDLEAARIGKTWLLLPAEYRGVPDTYPLPTSREELRRLVDISFPRSAKDTGCLYLRRARLAWLDKAPRRKLDPLQADEQRRVYIAQGETREFHRRMKKYQNDAVLALNTVHEEAAAAVATLNDLFSLVRAGVEGQMKAHLEGSEWKGEKISAKAARECFSMVTQAVKGFGLKSDQKQPAQDAIMEQAAEAIKATQEVVALAPGAPEGTEQ